jgi:succinate dehydrogenase / fumarate reductase iron-sulfur subunit
MVLSGKIPYPWQFQRSEGASEVKALIEAIAAKKDQQKNIEKNKNV